MATIIGATLRAYRKDRLGIGQRELGRRLADRLGRQSGAAVRNYIRAVERREQSEMPDEVADALAELLGVDVTELGGELVWALTIEGDGGGYLDLAGHAVAYSDLGAALDHRTALMLSVPPEERERHGPLGVVPVSRVRLRRELAANLAGNETLADSGVVIDPHDSVWMALRVLEDVLVNPAPARVSEAAPVVARYLDVYRLVERLAVKAAVIASVSGAESTPARRAQLATRAAHDVARVALASRANLDAA